MRRSTDEIQKLRATARTVYDAAVARAHPAGCLLPHLPAAPGRGRLILLAAGKAAGSMTALATLPASGTGCPAATIGICRVGAV